MIQKWWKQCLFHQAFGKLYPSILYVCLYVHGEWQTIFALATFHMSLAGPRLCHWGLQLLYRTLKNLSQSRWCLWLVFSPNWPKGSIFTCLPGLWLPLPSVICSMKKLSWGQASARALSRVKKSYIHSLSLPITSSLILSWRLRQNHKINNFLKWKWLFWFLTQQWGAHLSRTVAAAQWLL